MSTALYFPYIQVPQSAWFTQVLLYWDQAASIVPASLLNDRDLLDPYMRELANVQLLQLLSPDDEIGRVNHSDFTEGFLQLVPAPDTSPSASKNARFADVHSGKMSWGLFHELVGRGLARNPKGTEWETWFEVEEHTADLYMAYLATVMSTQLQNTLPVTDRDRNVGDLAGVEGTLAQRLAALRYVTITEALPAPSAPIPPAELRAFKDKHNDKLAACREYLDSRLVDLAAVEDSEVRVIKLRGLLQGIESEVATLQEAMTKHKWPVVLVGIGAVLGGSLGTGAGAMGDGSPLQVGLGVAAGVVGVGTAAAQATAAIKAAKQQPNSPLAYAVSAGLLEPAAPRWIKRTRTPD